MPSGYWRLACQHELWALHSIAEIRRDFQTPSMSFDNVLFESDGSTGAGPTVWYVISALSRVYSPSYSDCTTNLRPMCVLHANLPHSEMSPQLRERESMCESHQMPSETYYAHIVVLHKGTMVVFDCQALRLFGDLAEFVM